MNKLTEDEIIDMYLNDLPITNICAEMGIHPPTVYHVLAKYGIELRGRKLKLRESTPQLNPDLEKASETFRLSLVKEYLEEGRSITDLAGRNAMTYGKIRDILLKEGVTLRSKKGQWDLLRRAVLKTVEEGGDLNEFMKEYDLPAQIVYDWIRRASGPKFRVAIDEGAIVRRAVEQAKRELGEEKTEIEQLHLPGAEKWE